MRAAGYIRVSTDDQNLSIESQKARIKAYCELAQIQLSVMFLDEDVSGSVNVCERGQGKSLCAMVNDKEIDAVICVKLDRMFRSAADALITVDIWDKAGVSFHIIDMGGQSINTKSAMGKMMLTMLAGFAEFERNMISERTKSALNYKRDNLDVYGVVPFGFNQVGDKIEVSDDEMSCVKVIYKMRGSCSLKEIADRLNLHDCKSPGGKKWGKSSISYILRNPIYKNYVSDF